MENFVGIDIGGTYIKYGLLNKKGEILHKNQVKTHSKGKEIIQSIKEIVENYKSENEIQAVGISAPGIVEESGFMVTGGAIFDFYGIHLKNVLEKELSMPVTVENDANSAALAEKWMGSGQDHKNFFTVVVGTGIGGAIIINDEIYRGGHSSAGEFGFMINEPITQEDIRLSTVSLTSSVQGGLVHAYLKETSYEMKSEVDGKYIFDAAASGDKVAQKVIDSFYNNLARAIFNIIVSLDPEVVLVGGGISSNELFIEELNLRVKALQDSHRDMNNMTLAKIVPCKFLNDAGIVGATYRAIKEYGVE